MCDSAQYISDVQAAFKNTPALAPPTFRDTFYRIFKVRRWPAWMPSAVAYHPFTTSPPTHPPAHVV